MHGSVSRDLARTGMTHRARAQAVLAEIGLHPGQEILLRQLYDEDGRSPGELADCLCVEPPTVSKMVRRLAEAGFVARGPDPDDGRRTRVVLTDRGRGLEAPLTAAWAQLEQDTTACLTEDEVDELRRLLGKVRAALGADD